MLYILINVLYYNYFSTILTYHIDALLAYWNYLFYNLQLTKLYNKPVHVYVFKYVESK